MSTSFDETLLDVYYSAHAEGGSDWATAIIRSGDGGAIAHRAVTREDFIGRYEIEYGELEEARRSEIRTFAILRNGMARGFRFLAPDDSTFKSSRMGWLNPSTGEIEYLATANGSTNTFYCIRYYSEKNDITVATHVHRITKPSPYVDLVLRLGGSTATIAAIPAGDAIPTTSVGTVGGVGFTFYWKEGKVVFGSTPSNGTTVQINSGQYHLPVCFSEDWQRMRIDESAISEFRISLQEILPIEIGLT